MPLREHNYMFLPLSLILAVLRKCQWYLIWGEECSKRCVNCLVIIPRNMPTAEKWILVWSKCPLRHLSQVKCILVKELFVLQIKLLRLISKFPLPFQNNSKIMLMYQWQNVREGVRTGYGVWKYCLFRINVFKQYTYMHIYIHIHIHTHT